jgi:hypothetical protein
MSATFMTKGNISETNLIETLVAAAYTFEVSRFPDTPLNPNDRLIYADADTGRLLIARAPLAFLQDEKQSQQSMRRIRVAR